MEHSNSLLRLSVLRLLGELHAQTTGLIAPSESAQAAIAPPPAFKLPDPSGRLGLAAWATNGSTSASGSPFADPQARRALMVNLWYPAPRSAPGNPEPYLPGARQMDGNRTHDRVWRKNWRSLAAHRLRRYQVARDRECAHRKQSEAISAGASLARVGGSGFEYAALIEELVSHGYVVAAIEHTDTAAAVTFPTARWSSRTTMRSRPGSLKNSACSA